ncbi:MAG TPA: bifunctional O-acetylhomoserine aminocarboxypropyltransferase/cysteine synthase [Ruminococcaceae bacterium]|nr:bifunctional O-acetylhomoserine aminocarboxypropyltransferase/cysteine synthase [Oscillospiraceae bacterium]
MNRSKEWHIETKCIQEGWKPTNGQPRVLPIVQSTTFKYDSADTLGDLFDLKIGGDFYTRLSNPTTNAVEAKIAALEGGVGALMTSAGQAASLMSVINITHSGDHIISSVSIYGGTFNLFDKTLREMGIDVTFVSADADEDELDAVFQPNTKLVFGETLSNPGLNVLDIEKFANVAHRHGVPLIVDNTFPTPVNCRPFEFGADIVVHSTSKYLDGHATALGGVIVDSGGFDWAASDKFPGLTTPDETYHGLTYTQSFGTAAYITKCRTHLMRDIGATPSPMNAFYLSQGIDTLHLRMERHCSNAQKVAEFLENDDRIAWVNYPGLKSSKYYALAQKYMPNGTSGVISFGIKGGRGAACRFMEKLELAAIAIHVADLRTSVLHPASTTHRQMSDAQLAVAGISPDLIRFSVGIEHPNDIIADIDQALNAL